MSDHGLHSLHPGILDEIEIKTYSCTRHPKNYKWTCPHDSKWEVHSAYKMDLRHVLVNNLFQGSLFGIRRTKSNVKGKISLSE